ncbi:MAG TPA: hypothetical protein VF540_02690, partial [Segetibacter sp.]
VCTHLFSIPFFRVGEIINRYPLTAAVTNCCYHLSHVSQLSGSAFFWHLNFDQVAFFALTT